MSIADLVSRYLPPDAIARTREVMVELELDEKFYLAASSYVITERVHSRMQAAFEGESVPEEVRRELARYKRTRDRQWKRLSYKPPGARPE